MDPKFGSISTHRKYFFQFFFLIFYTSKTIAKTLVHLILRTFAIFNPTYRALIAALIALNDEIETHSVS